MTARDRLRPGALVRAWTPWVAGTAPLAGAAGWPRLLGILLVLAGLAAIGAGLIVGRERRR